MYRSYERDPNWARTHHLLATLIEVLEVNMWGFGGQKGPRPLTAKDRTSWLTTKQQREADTRREHAAVTAGIIAGEFDYNKHKPPGAPTE